MFRRILCHFFLNSVVCIWSFFDKAQYLGLFPISRVCSAIISCLFTFQLPLGIPMPVVESIMELLRSNWRLTTPGVIITPAPPTGPHLQEPTNTNNHCSPQVPTVSSKVNKPLAQSPIFSYPYYTHSHAHSGYSSQPLADFLPTCLVRLLSYGNENDDGYDKHLRSRTELLLTTWL